MDFTADFESQFESSQSLHAEEIELVSKLQETRSALQESLSENDQLISIIDQFYLEIGNEKAELDNLLSEISKAMFKNLAAPEDPKNLSVSERAGYSIYYMKFLGFSLRKMTEEFYTIKDHMESLQKSVVSNTASVSLRRTGAIKVPKLSGQKNEPALTNGNKTKPPISVNVPTPDKKSQSEPKSAKSKK